MWKLPRNVTSPLVAGMCRPSSILCQSPSATRYSPSKRTWAAVALLTVYVALRACDRSCLREAEALRGQPTGKPAPLQEKPFPASVLRADLYAAAIVFIVLGVMNGGLYDVLVKAINICTECIGLG